jgi:hypothetical protein
MRSFYLHYLCLVLFTCTSICLLTWRVHELEAMADTHKVSLTKVEATVKEEAKGLGRLREHVVLLFERHPDRIAVWSGAGPAANTMVVFSGEVRQVTPDSISILPAETGQPIHKFILGPEALVTVNGNKARLHDVAIGMQADIARDRGQVTSIQARSGSQ